MQARRVTRNPPSPWNGYVRPFLASLALGAMWVAQARAQETYVDRWLVTGGPPSAESSVGESDAPLLPDRNAEAGPGTWTLIRDDGRHRFDFSTEVGPGESAFLHVYLRAPEDMNIGLSLAVDACASSSAWLNGQPLPDPSHRHDVRLAGGWNSLLAILGGDPDCPRAISAELSAPSGPQDKDQPSEGVSSLRIQASRPPGARPNYPAGSVTVEGVDPVGLSWGAGLDDLVGTVRFSVTSWGRIGSDVVEDERPADPPEIDLTGEWAVTVFGPTGIQRSTAELAMADDGTLTGEMRPDRGEGERGQEGERFERERRGGGLEGEIRDGWVSRDRFGWSLRTSIGRRSIELEFTGTVRAGKLQGTIDFGGFRDFESRFEGRRLDADTEPPVPDEAPPAPGLAPAGDEPVPEVGQAGEEPGAATTPDPNGQRAQMIRQLLGPPVVRAPAPSSTSIDLRIGGTRIERVAEQLAPGVPHEMEGQVPFRKLREAALRTHGVEGRLRWDDERLDVRGILAPESILEAFHAPIELAGLVDGGDGVLVASFRIPDALAGFTLRGGTGAWRVDGEEAVDGVICVACKRGRRLEIGFRPSDASSPQVQITDPGYPDAGTAGPPAAVWLKALEGDNRKYRELAMPSSPRPGSSAMAP